MLPGCRRLRSCHIAQFRGAPHGARPATRPEASFAQAIQPGCLAVACARCTVVRCPLSVVRCPLSVVRCPLSVVRCPGAGAGVGAGAQASRQQVDRALPIGRVQSRPRCPPVRTKPIPRPDRSGARARRPQRSAAPARHRRQSSFRTARRVLCGMLANRVSSLLPSTGRPGKPKIMWPEVNSRHLPAPAGP